MLMAAKKPVLLIRPVNVTPMLIPNMGLGYLATRLRERGHPVEILDCIKERVGLKALGERIGRGDYGVVGLQVYTFDMEPARRHLAVIAEASPEVIRVAGGPHPSADPDGTMVLPFLDYAFRSEAEEGLPAFCDLAFEAGYDRERLASMSSEFSSVPNLVWRNGETLCKNPVALAPDLDALPFPAWDLIDPRSYPVAPQGTFTRRIPVAPTILTRGCPYPCTFCAASVNTGKPIRYRSPENLIEELRLLKRDYGVREIHFEDDNFTLNHRKCAEVCEALCREKLDLCWALPNGVRLDTLDEELLRLMEQSGCYSMAVGIESGSQRILDLMQKRISLDLIEEKIALIKRVTKMKITGFFIIGYPGETKKEIRETIAFSRKLPIDKANFGIYMPLPGTTSYQALREAGELEGYDPSKVTEYRAAYAPPGISNGEMRRYLKWAFFSFYARPRVVRDVVSGIKHWDQLRILARRFFEVFSVLGRSTEPQWHL